MSPLKKIILVAFGVLFLASCTRAIIDETEIVTPIDETVNYNDAVKTIMTNHCITCHGGLAPSANLPLTTYDEVREAAENRGLVERMNSDFSPMPPSGVISASERQVIDKWIADNFLE